ncbi:MAG: metallophosphoesterase [Methylobacter sp.]
MRINYFSDIHLEFESLKAPNNDADIIVAAGDIGIGTQGVDWLKTFGKPVIYVAGNHEFYSGDYHQSLQMLRQQCDGSNIHFLENDSLIFQDVRFLGCTLWADLFVEGEIKAEALVKSLNDFKRIQMEGQTLDAAQFSRLFHSSKTWLEQQLAQPFSGQTVIVTHHAPSLWSWSGSNLAAKKLAYCNDLKYLLHEHEIAAWIHGHVHSQMDYRIADARILCNPRGYAGVKLAPRFDQNKVVEI